MSKFYKARLEDLAIGQTIYYLEGGQWRPMLLQESDFIINPTGQNNLSVIISNLLRFRNKEKDYYRIKLLEGVDIETLGFESQMVETPTIKKIFKSTKYQIDFYPKSKRVDVYQRHKIKNKNISAVSEEELETLFTGQILNQLELITILKATAVMFTPARKLLINKKL